MLNAECRARCGPASATRESHPIQSLASLSPRRSELEHLQPIVPRVHRDDAVLLVHRDAPRVRQLARVAAAGAPGLQALAGLLVDHLHAVVAELADDQPCPSRPCPGRRGSGIAPEPGADPAHVADERAVGLEDRDAVVARVGDVDESRRRSPSTAAG